MPPFHSLDDLVELVTTELARGDLSAVASALGSAPMPDVAVLLERLPAGDAGVAFRLLPKDEAMTVFERMDAPAQREVVAQLSDADVARVFSELDPDDRVALMDELPAKIAKRLIQDLPADERGETAIILGYPVGCVGRHMTPDYVHVYPHERVGVALERIRQRGGDAETIYTIPVIDDERRLLGVVSLRELFFADSDDAVEHHMATALYAHADDDAEVTARTLVDRGVLAMPIVDSESRLIGLLTSDDAHRMVEAARDEDEAHAGAAEPLRRPYLTTPVFAVVRSRIVWLFVLAVSAILTVSVLELFEATLEQQVALALFIPLLTGIGGNTGSQAATTVTRALAMGEVRPRNAWPVALKELRTGIVLGMTLGAVAFAIATTFYGIGIGTVIGLTLLSVCTISATVGGVMPLVAKSIRVDPAVFSTPFISTFCDATGLLVYFSIAKSVLGI
ncbi:magnesium transporter [Pseudoclavibacter sp. RFBA6]|uniref:magnesium transporter n=1 Tax=Pseudoclavibacter sp. RFBA6 TaxID=2080573 RepID=UPI000CE78A50|nr:magnesium transporter [Pseudoclavibacter sp. RFBA6]PPG40673.1 magnesium transporter [Pseudoclavibacter sp. RFBA6]